MRFNGQLSFDLIFAVIAFLLLLQFLVSVLGSFEENQNSLLLRDQAQAIALTVAKMASYESLFSGESEQSYAVPLLNGIAKKNIPCTISVLGTTVTVTVKKIDSGLDEDVTTSVELGKNVPAFSGACGSTLVVS